MKEYTTDQHRDPEAPRQNAQGWAPPSAAGTIGGDCKRMHPDHQMVLRLQSPPIAQPGRAGLPTLSAFMSFMPFMVNLNTPASAYSPQRVTNQTPRRAAPEITATPYEPRISRVITIGVGTDCPAGLLRTMGWSSPSGDSAPTGTMVICGPVTSTSRKWPAAAQEAVNASANRSASGALTVTLPPPPVTK